ncbi:YraN family protein [Pectobacteriaceae bacterium CE70]|uniref:YraN family protein n=1 Tax=Serratia sp. (strain ATCC 39006) TaxID=104623 RepID=UPI00156EBBEE|nr:YraN family protein [Serratia sp. ATCC 39006]WJV64624.1 YraN family protein [Pectobacteriaceae bacterium C52]WJV68928.1 YraN family protein [Pectobacteriaceae bacterium CE70]WJY12868.1 YraN family protein [Pectobacteriaceae bacterium C80]
MNHRATGTQFEQQARRYLEHAGLVFVAANVTLRGGELDLIMQDRQTLVFVEVRYRRNADFGDAAASVTWRKQRRLLHAAAVWLSRQGGSLDTIDCRFDVLAITGNQIDWIPNAFAAHT